MGGGTVFMASKRDKKKRHRITLKGHGSFICEPHELESMLQDMNEDGGSELIVDDVWMTDDEVDRLPEFTGF